jgi:hypothetical protein
MSRTFTIAGRRFQLDPTMIEAELAAELPEPLRDHFVVVGARRFPPKQVLSRITGLDRADFTTHHARRVLRRLGFPTGRSTAGTAEPRLSAAVQAGPHGGRQAEALRPYVGKWVALGEPWEVLVAADAPEDVLAWLTRHDRTATGMFRVPERQDEAEGLAPR